VVGGARRPRFGGSVCFTSPYFRSGRAWLKSPQARRSRTEHILLVVKHLPIAGSATCSSSVAGYACLCWPRIYCVSASCASVCGVLAAVSIRRLCSGRPLCLYCSLLNGPGASCRNCAQTRPWPRLIGEASDRERI